MEVPKELQGRAPAEILRTALDPLFREIEDGHDWRSFIDEESRIKHALHDLNLIHPEARETFEFGISYDWSQDRWAGGIGPLFRPNDLKGSFLKNIARPVNRVWFANDACDPRHRRWIEGSIASAVRNAVAIHSGVRNTIPGLD